MKYEITTYKTLQGIKEIVKIKKQISTKWVIYEDNEPKYLVDLFDLTTESNAMMNSLVLCAKRSINETLRLINKKNNINLTLPKVSPLSIKLKSEEKPLDLVPIPEKWLAYSL
jgi:hypothetical protein